MVCDLCGSSDALHVLDSARLDGPLVRCRRCGLVYVGRRGGDFTFTGGADADRSSALADRVAALGIVDHAVEDAELRHRLAADRERIERLRRHAPATGTLLDVGAATGALLEAAGESFADVEGVEPDPITSEQARAAGHRVRTGTLEDVVAPNGGFDAITMVHTLEHLDSPRRALERARELLAPGGAILIETPTTDCLWFRVAPGRWRQLIPDHYYFFSRATLTALLASAGLEPIEHAKVGRRVTIRFAADRLRRAGVPLAGAVAAGVARIGIGDHTVRLNPGDIMSLVARR
ncbi:MAG TPA: methyltransferase domain-containing protein [Solirubrobacteraceae bacterium]|nr:methyltransferase domain-containing protein [Solirubrobacteraceae bacterium]